MMDEQKKPDKKKNTLSMAKVKFGGKGHYIPPPDPDTHTDEPEKEQHGKRSEN